MPLPMFKPKETSKTPSKKVKRVIAVGAGKGGVGKSTVACELAVALIQQGYAVGLLDADMYGPSIGRMLKLDKKPEKQSERFIPGQSFGIKVMTMAFFREAGDSIIARAPIIIQTLLQLVQKVDWGSCDYLIIDLPPGTGDIPLTLGQELKIDGAVLVTTPQKVACDDVRKAAELFTKLRVPILGIIENMSYIQAGTSRIFPFGQGGANKLAHKLQVPLLGQLPISEKISHAGDQGTPLSVVEPKGEIGKQMREVAKGVHRLSNELETKAHGHLRDFHLEWKEFEVCPK